MDSLKGFEVYIPIDRQLALVQDLLLPNRAQGTALFADISGFTLFAEALAQELGPQLGAEQLNFHLNRLFKAIIVEVHSYRGSVVSISGDSITCWFDQDPGLRAATSALAIRSAMDEFSTVTTPSGSQFSLGIKTALASGPVRRFLIGSLEFQRIDVLAGHTLNVLAAIEQLAERNQVCLAPETLTSLEGNAQIIDWRVDEQSGQKAAILKALTRPAEPTPWPEIQPGALTDEHTRAWLLPNVLERLQQGTGQFLADLRPVTALFLSFSGIDYDEDDDAGLLLDAYIRHVQKIVHQNEGALLDLTIGDKGSYLFAAFGAPVAHDDDATRALVAAYELRESPTNLSFIQDIHIGIAHGLVYAGAYGAPDRRVYGVQGDKVNLAARLMQYARPGEILCDEDVYHLEHNLWSFEALPPVRVKGKAGLVRVYRAIGRNLGAKASTPTTFFGREAELEKLEAALSEILAGKSKLLFVEGEAGIGKSRLISEMVRRMQSRGVAGLLGAGRSTEKYTPYRAWRDIFESYFDIESLHYPKERLAKVQSVFQEVAPKMIQRLPLLNDIINLDAPDTPLTLALDPTLRQESLMGLLIHLLSAWLQERPLVLVLEDSHWLDSLSWKLAVQMARVLLPTNKPLLMVIVNRSMDERSPGVQSLATLQAIPGSETLSLAGISPQEIISLANAQLGLSDGNLPEPIETLVTQRSEGNPFFAQELIYTLRDRGLIEIRDSEAGRVCNTSPSLQTAQSILPDTLQGLILARIDQLPPDRQFALKVAAVIGRSFAYPPLHATLSRLMPALSTNLSAYLQEMVQRNLIYAESLEPEFTYLFKHIITQEVAYQTLLSNQRREIHRTVAEWYENQLQPESAAPGQADAALLLPLLVYHYYHAGETERERTYAQQAGEQAVRQYANFEAIRYFSRALELTPSDDLELHYDLRLARQKVYDLQAARTEQSQDLERLEEIVGQLNDPLKQADIALEKSQHRFKIGELDKSVKSAERAIQLAKTAGNIAIEAQAYTQLGSVLWRQARYAEARQRLERALALAQQAHSSDLEASIYRNLGIVADLSERLDEAKSYFLRALEISRQHGDREVESRSMNNLGINSWRRGDYAEAQHYFEQSLALDRELGARYGESLALGNLAMIMDAQGRYDLCRMYAEQALVIAQETGNQYGISRILGMLGSAMASQGDLEASYSVYQKGLEHTRVNHDRQDEIFQLTGLAHVLLLLGDYSAARSFYEQSLEISQEIGQPDGEFFAENNLALIYHQLGDHQAGREHAERALALAQEAGNPDNLASAQINLGHALLGLGEPPEAAQAYETALALVSDRYILSTRLEIYAGLARVALAQGNIEKACAQVNAVLENFIPSNLDGANDRYRVYLTCYDVLHVCGDSRAHQLLHTAYEQLLSQADRFSSTVRKTFLENVPSNRELLMKIMKEE